MTARYELRPVGVFDRHLNRVIGRRDQAWAAYQAWVAAGNAPESAVPLARSLELRRAEAAAAVNVARARALAGGLDFEGHRYDTNEASRAQLTAAVATVNAGFPLLDGFTWRTENNLDVAMDEPTLLSLAFAMYQHAKRIYRHSWKLKHAIAASAEPESIDVASGWPE